VGRGLLDVGVFGLAHGIQLQMMLGLLQSGEVLLHALPKLVLSSLHELARDILLVALPIVLRHLKLIMIVGWMR
jgi:hypothetical protein